MSESRNNHESNHDEIVLERNVEQLIARGSEAPRMSAEARGRVLSRIKAHARERGEAKVERREPVPAMGWRPAWAAGAVMAVGLAAVGVSALIVDGGAVEPSVHSADAVRVVALDDGSEMILNRGARAVVVGDRRVRVEHGAVLLDVAKGQGQFIVESPHGKLRVLGTRFVVDAGDGETRAAVVRGRVEARNDAGSAVLRAGEEAVLRDGKAPIRRRAPRLSHLVGWAKLAKRQDERPAVGPARRGTLIARNPNWQTQEYPLPMRELAVDVHVENQIARVALDQTFFNTQNQQLEGVYHLALPADASIYRQAMYVQGKRMESAVVERRRARQIYDEIVYQARDPALMEWMAGNLYKVRIFPIFGRTEKRIVFGYTQPLSRLYGDYRIEVPLPAVDAPVDRVSYKVRLAGCASCTVASTSHTMTSKVDGNDLLVSYSAERHGIGEDLVLTVRDPQTAPRVVRAEKGKHRYMMVRAQPVSGGQDAVAAEHQQRRWVILHDTSASRQPLDRKAQAHLIDQLLRQLDEDDEVQVMAFDAGIRQQAAGFTRVADVDRREVAEFLRRESADGVGYTDLAAALRAAVGALEAADGSAAPNIIYLGDGIVTAGERELERLRRAVEGKATFVGIAVGERMDMRVLRELADVTGGMAAVMNPGDDLGWRAFDLVAALSTPRVVDLQVSLVDAKGAPVDGDVYPSIRQIADGEELVVVARGDVSRAVALELAGRRDGERWSTRIDLPAQGDGNAGYLPRVWAQAHVDRLMTGDTSETRAEITTLGTEHFLVTPFTSLLVLENDKMYAQYKVKRDRAPRWAEYALPDTIKVVHEPVGAGTGIAANAPLDAQLVRTPTRALQGYGYTGTGAGFGGESGEAWFADATVNGAFDVGVGDLGGAVVGSGVGGGGTGVVAQAPSGRTAAASSEPASDRDMEPINESSTIVTSEDLGRNKMDRWEVQLGTRGGFREGERLQDSMSKRSSSGLRNRRGGGRLDAYRQLTGGKGRGSTRGPMRGGLILDGRRSANLHGRYYHYGWASPQPVAYHYPGDVRLDDLTEHVPGLFADAFDVQMRDLRGAGKKGSVTKDARSLIEGSRKRLGHMRFENDGITIETDRRGTLRVGRTLEVGLSEELLFDGAWLYHLYPQLGVATRRRADDAAAAVYDHWAPFLLAPADALARWYDITRPSSKVLRLVPAGTGAASAAVEITLDDDQRVREIARVEGATRAVLLSATWTDAGVVLVQHGKSMTLTGETSGPVGGVDTSAWAVVEMPLRQPAYLEKRLEGASGPSVRGIERQLLASWAAIGNVAKMVEVAEEMARVAPLNRGELTLVSRAARSMGDAQLRTITKGADDEDPVVAFVRASQGQRSKQSPAQFDRVAKKYQGFIGTLAAYRGLMAVMWRYDQSRSGALVKRVRGLVDRGAAPLFLYIAAHRYANTYGYYNRKDTAAVWDRVAEALPAATWRPMARLEAARSLYNRAQYSEAAERYEQMLSELPSDAALPPLDHTAQYAFRNSGRGEAGWKLFWARWRDQALRRGDTDSLLALARSAAQLGQQRDLDRVSAKLIDVGTYEPEVAVAVAQTLQQTGRAAQALAVLEPHLGSGDADLLALASVMAEQQGRLEDAAEYFDRALKAYTDEPVSLSMVRSDYQRMLNLLGRLSQTTGGDTRKEYVERAKELAARWRQVDPDNDQLDQQMARTLYAVGRSEEAWRYLTGAIERHPGEGQAYQAVAVVLEEEGQVDKAVALWERAAELDPENPTWLLRWANALYAAGDRKGGDALIDRIDAAEWHERFRQTLFQVKRLKQHRK